MLQDQRVNAMLKSVKMNQATNAAQKPGVQQVHAETMGFWKWLSNRKEKKVKRACVLKMKTDLNKNKQSEAVFEANAASWADGGWSVEKDDKRFETGKNIVSGVSQQQTKNDGRIDHRACDRWWLHGHCPLGLCKNDGRINHRARHRR
jgi:hypothetical protein